MKLLFFVLITVILWASPVRADIERYIAVPMGSGGYVFILDTREGHAWTWSTARRGQVNKSGENPRFVYQGNVRQNMRPPKLQDEPALQPEQPHKF